MSEDDKDQLRSHSYDGIQEYDNQLPRWWVQLFWITIIFTPLYMYYYHFKGEDAGLEHDYKVAKLEAKQLAASRPNPAGDMTEEQLLALTKDEQSLKHGSTIFTEKCASCHGDHGQGLVGPNLTDDYWIHGSQMKNVVNTIRVGVPAKGMIPWGGMLKDDEIHAVAAFIKSLHGTNPANAKAPEGTKD